METNLEEKYQMALKKVEELQKRVDLLNRMRGSLLRSFTETFAQAYGEKAFEVVEKLLVDVTRQSVQNLVSRMKVERNAKGAAEILANLHGNQGMIGSIVEATSQRAVRQERVCVMGQAWGYDMCHRFSLKLYQTICDAVNPSLTVRHTKFLNGEDDCCEIIFELREKQA